MHEFLENIRNLFKKHFGVDAEEVLPLPPSGCEAITFQSLLLTTPTDRKMKLSFISRNS